MILGEDALGAASEFSLRSTCRLWRRERLWLLSRGLDHRILASARPPRSAWLAGRGEGSDVTLVGRRRRSVSRGHARHRQALLALVPDPGHPAHRSRDAGHHLPGHLIGGGGHPPGLAAYHQRCRSGLQPDRRWAGAAFLAATHLRHPRRTDWVSISARPGPRADDNRAAADRVLHD